MITLLDPRVLFCGDIARAIMWGAVIGIMLFFMSGPLIVCNCIIPPTLTTPSPVRFGYSKQYSIVVSEYFLRKTCVGAARVINSCFEYPKGSGTYLTYANGITGGMYIDQPKNLPQIEPSILWKQGDLNQHRWSEVAVEIGWPFAWLAGSVGTHTNGRSFVWSDCYAVFQLRSGAHFVIPRVVRWHVIAIDILIYGVMGWAVAYVLAKIKRLTDC